MDCATGDAPDCDSVPRDRRTRRHVQLLWAILALALVVRLLLFCAGPMGDWHRAFEMDTPRYVDLAQNLVRTETFGLENERAGIVHVSLARLREELGQREARNAVGLYPEIFRTPGYPLFIALALWLGLTLHAVVLVQCVLSAACVALVYGIARRLTSSPAVGLWAALLLACHPADIVFANTLLSETLFTFCLLLSFWMTLIALPRAGLCAAIGGLAMGAAALVRPVAFLLGPVLAGWIVLTRREPRRWLTASLLLLGSMLPVLGWMARNHAAGFRWQMSSVSTLNGLFYTAAYAEMTAQGKDTLRDWPGQVRLYFDDLRRETKPDEDVFVTASRLTRQKLAQQPRGYAAAMLRSGGKFLVDHSMPDLHRLAGRTYRPSGLGDRILGGRWREVRLTDLASVVPQLAWVSLNALLALATAAGLWLLARRGQRSEALLLAGLLVYFMLTTQTNGLERFRVPVIGLQAVAAAIAITAATRAVRGATVAPPSEPLPLPATRRRPAWADNTHRQSASPPTAALVAAVIAVKPPSESAEGNAWTDCNVRGG